MAAAGLCHSDLSVIDGSRPRPTPMALGHEAAGIVEAVGDGVTDLSRGSRGAGVRRELRPLRPLRVGTSRALRAGGQERTPPERCFPASAGFPFMPSPSTTFLASRLFQPMRLWRANPGEDPPRPAAGTRGLVRLRGADRGRRGGQHRRSSNRANRSRWWAWAAWA